MLRIAVPNKGVLSEPAAEMLAESGYRQRRSTKDLAVYDPENDTEFFYLRPRDIAVYVAAGTLDVGITGRDMLLETAPADGDGRRGRRGHAAGLRPLVVPVRQPRSSPAIERGRPAGGQADRHRLPGAAAAVPGRAGIKAGVVKLDGAVETACRLGVADAVCDVVETGTTLRAAGLHIIGEPVLTSEAILVRREGAEEIPAVAQLRRRLRGVLVARQYVLLDYDCPNELLRAGDGDHARARGPDGQPAADAGLVGGARDGAPGRHQPGHGRALGARRPGDPGHQHPRLPHLTPRRIRLVAGTSVATSDGVRLLLPLLALLALLTACARSRRGGRRRGRRHRRPARRARLRARRPRRRVRRRRRVAARRAGR